MGLNTHISGYLISLGRTLDEEKRTIVFKCVD